MWREYTRETPARPGWAIVSAGLALVLTTSLAWVLTTHGPAEAVGRTESPSNWPISFSVPADAKPFTESNHRRLSSDETGNAGFVAYTWGTGDAANAARILIAYKVYDDESGLIDIGSEFFSEDAAEADVIEIGPLTGRLIVSHARTGSRIYSALASLDEGLAIRIDLISPPGTRNSEGLFRRICRSVSFKDWYLPRPTNPYFYLDRFIPKL